MKVRALLVWGWPTLFCYGVIFLLIILFDQISKSWALAQCTVPFVFFPGFACQLSLNRGISCGLFQASSEWWFVVQSTCIGLIILLLIGYAIKKARTKKSILGEVLVVAGGLSNMIDRIWHHSVVDFIVLYYKNYQIPNFNLADAVIVLGVFIMIIDELCYDV